MTPETDSLLAACAIAFVGVVIGGGLQWTVLRDTKGDLGAGGGLPMNLGLGVVASVGLAMAIVGPLSGARIAALFASHALGWITLWLWSRRRSRR